MASIYQLFSASVLRGCIVGAFLGLSSGFGADAESETQRQLRLLQEQNQLLQRQVNQQQMLIEDLNRKVTDIQTARQKSAPADRSAFASLKEEPAATTRPSGLLDLGKVHLSGEGGLAFFHSGARGPFPNSEFRVDEAKLFVEAPIWKNVYLFTELNIATRESDNINLSVGELYLDFEGISALWNREQMLNLRVGRFDIPFGEEYLARDAIDNSLISHSLSDLWGVDEGVEFYGSLGRVQYVLAVQNGGPSSLRDYNSDKAVVGRLSYDPATWLHLSASGMRTGALDAQRDFVSELWFGNGLIRSLSVSGAATSFEAKVFEGDAQIKLPHGHIKAAGGYLDYDDNDPTANNRRHCYYYYVEGLHSFTKKFYAAARWSHIMAGQGFPLVGNGDFNDYFFNELTKDLKRLSLGAGYRWSPSLLTKIEYTFDKGRELGGALRNHENLFAVEVAFKF